MLKSRLSKSILPAWVILGVGLLATVFTSLQVKQSIEQDAVRQFALACDQVTLKIQERLDAYALILRGGAALFAASIAVDRHKWQAYVETLRAEGSVPGVQGIGFAQVIPANELAAHIAHIRGEGFPEYTVRPSGERAIYTSIIYLEPFRDRNLRAFGYDMFSEPVRRVAMERARDTGDAALSGKVELVQENGTEVQAGALVYVPVYRNGVPTDTIGQKRAALIGWVYSPFRMNDLMTGILSDWMSDKGKTIDMQIYDGPQAAPATLLFDRKVVHVVHLHSLFYQQRTINFNGHQWLLVFDHTSTSAGISYVDAWATLIGGLALSGFLFWLLISMRASAIRDIAAHELAARRQVEASRMQLAAIVESSNDAIIGKTTDGIITSWNKSAENIYGYSADEIIGRHVTVIAPPSRHTEIYELLEKVSKGGTVVNHESERIRKDGSLFNVALTLSPIKDASGKITGISTIARDITEKKRLEEELRQLNTELEQRVQNRTRELSASEERMRLFFERQLVGMAITSPEKGWVKVNDKICEMMGYSPEELARLSWAEMTYPEDLAPDEAQFKRLLNGEIDSYTLEKRFVRKDGSIVFTNLSVGCVRRADQSVDYVLALLEDITEQKSAEESIKKLNDELQLRAKALEGANQELESFSYSVSHDLRTPLRAIDGFSHILLEDYADKLDDEGKRLLNIVRDNTSRMGQLIDDILKFSRTGRLELSFTEINMEKLAHEVFEELQPSDTDSKLQLEVEPIPPVTGDSAMMRQVFVNLLSNAIKFSRPRETARIKVGGSIEGNEAIYYVKDNGVGFDMQYVDKLFGVFQRLHGVTEFEGTGIGLAIVKRIITRHGGRVWAEGKVNEDATIYFALPTKEKNHG